MANINWKSVIIGGLAAGLIINIGEATLNLGVIAEQSKVAMQALGKNPEISGTQIALFNLLGFVGGITTVWLYAAMRPRYGAGPRTALCAGGAYWFMAFLLGSIPPLVLDLFPMNLMIIGWAWGLVETLIAAYVGGRIYKEEAAEPRPLIAVAGH